MKTLPKLPYLQNIVAHYNQETGLYPALGSGYREWLKQFGFSVPVRNDCLEFPDDFSDHDLMLFVLRWR